MILSAASRALSQLFSKPFRTVFWKSLGVTVALLIGAWFALNGLLHGFVYPYLDPWPWLETVLAWLLGAGLIVGMGFLIAPVTSVFAGIFLDEIAEDVEEAHYPGDPPGRELPLMQSIVISVKFFGLVVLGNLAALFLLFFLGLGVFAFFLVNGYLLGREYFQFAGLRHMTVDGLEDLRRRHQGTIFLAGLLIAGFLSIPFVNLLTPLFAAALMTHVFKAVSHPENVRATG